MDGVVFFCVNRAALVDRLADNVNDTAKRLRADRNTDRSACVCNRLAADETLCRIHSDGTDGVLTKVLRYFENEVLAIVRERQRVHDRRQLAFELNVDNGAQYLRYFAHCAFVFCCEFYHFVFSLNYTASAPEMISMSSLVMYA